jgi:hypothetical protein
MASKTGMKKSEPVHDQPLTGGLTRLPEQINPIFDEVLLPI